jgi:hypothetical protein
MRELLRRFVPFWISLVVGPILLAFGSLQAAATPPNTVWAHAFFPVPFLIGVILEYFRPGEDTTVGFVSILILTLLQIATYGLALSLSLNRWRTAALLFGIHVFLLGLGVVIDLILMKN